MKLSSKKRYVSLLAAGKLGVSSCVQADYSDGSTAIPPAFEQSGAHYVVTCEPDGSCSSEALTNNSNSIAASEFSADNQHLALTLLIKQNSSLPSGGPVDIYLAYSESLSQASEWPQAAAGQLLIPADALEVVSVTRVTPAPLVDESHSGTANRYQPVNISVAIPNLDSITGEKLHFQAVAFPADTFDWSNATASEVLTYKIDRDTPIDNPFLGK